MSKKLEELLDLPDSKEIIKQEKDKEKLDKDGKPDGDSIVQGEGYIVTDRNSLLEKLKNMDK